MENNIDGNFDELSAISGHLVILPFRNHQILVTVHNHALATLLPFENNMFCWFQSAEVLKALLKNWTSCEYKFSYLVNVSKGSILHLI